MKLNKMLVLIIILLTIIMIVCGCEDKTEQDKIRQCELIGGTTIIEYCKGATEICKVRCEVNRNE